MTTDLRVTVSGSDNGLERVLKQTEAATTRAERAMAQYNQTATSTWSSVAALEKQLERDTQGILDRKHEAYTQLGRGMMITGGLIAAGLGLAGKAAMDWETAWTGVTKTVDGSHAEMQALEADLRNLAKTLPVTHEEIAAVAEAAGQLGVARADIADFTKTVIDMSVSTNLTADQAATDMARFANIMQTPTSEVDRLGSAIVALGNDGASTESEILSMGMRIAAAGNLVGMSEGQVLAYANALSSVGIEAEAGGTAVSLTLAQMAQAVDEGGDKLDAFASVAGMSSDQFATAFRDDAASAINTFLMGLDRVNTSGGSVFATLDQLGVAGIRQRDTLLRLAGAGDILSNSLETGSEAWIENIALTQEADRFYGTSANRLKAAGNEAKDLAIDMGAVLLPALVAVGETFANLTTFVGDLPGPLKTAAVVLAVLTAGVTLFGGAALVAIPKIAALKATVEGLEAGAMKRAGSSVLGLGSALMGPLGIALAAATVGVGIWAAKQGEAARAADALKATLDEQTGALTDNSREWAVKELSDSGALSAAKTLGISLETVTDAALGNTEAIAAVNAELAEYENQNLRGGGSSNMRENAEAAEMLSDAVGGTNGTLEEAREKWENEQAAKGKSTDGSKEAADGFATAGGEAGELTEEVESLKDAFDALSGAFLTERDASRGVREGLRGIREAMKEYREEHGNLNGAFRRGTESGDRFAAMLDDQAKAYQDKITATRDAGASERRVNQVYEQSRRNLQRVAQQMGMTRDQARTYVAQVLDIPELVTTRAELKTEQASAELESFIRDASGRTISIGTRIVASSAGIPGGKTFQADGSLLDFYAGGGVRENHVAQIAPAGAWRVWAEPETGGEAYIPLSPAKRGRSLDIWEEVGQRLGVKFERFAAGGVSGGIAPWVGQLASPGGMSLMAEYVKAVQENTRAQREASREQRQASAAQKRMNRFESLVETRSNAPSRLDMLQQQQQVRGLRRSLAAKGEDRLEGLSRKIAQQELKEQTRELARMEKATKAADRARRNLAKGYGNAAQESRRLAKAERELEAAQQARADAQERLKDLMAAAQDVQSNVMGQGEILGGGGVASTSRRMDRLISDVSNFNQVYAALAAAGASPWLLGQMAEAARSGDYASAVRFGRQLLSDRDAFTNLEAKGQVLGVLGAQQGGLMYGDSAAPAIPLAQMAAASGATVVPGMGGNTTNNYFQISSPQVDLVANEVLRRLNHVGG